MIIVTTSQLEQTIKIIPSSTSVAEVTLFLRSETDKDINLTQNITSVNNNGYMSLSFTFDKFKEGETYFFEVKKTFFPNDPILYRGLIFCTDQISMQNYKIIPEAKNNVIVI